MALVCGPVLYLVTPFADSGLLFRACLYGEIVPGACKRICALTREALFFKLFAVHTAETIFGLLSSLLGFIFKQFPCVTDVCLFSLSLRLALRHASNVKAVLRHAHAYICVFV